MRRIMPAVVMLGLLTACEGNRSGGAAGSEARESAAALYAQATSLASTGDFESALASLRRSLLAGYATPSDVLHSQPLRPLLNDPALRSRTRDLLKRHAREHSITMVRTDEPGEPMVLRVRVVAAEASEPPIAADPAEAQAGVLVGIVHVDAAGYYQPWPDEQDWNPRLFGFAMTDETGTVTVRTIRPSYYAPEYEAPDEPRHVHYNIEHDGALLRASEFFFDDDPRLTGDARSEAEARGVPIARVHRDDEGVWHSEVTIPVQGLR